MIECHDLSRRYGDFTAVRGVSFSVADGEILGILGPNGAGKTTTIRMITGFLPPTTGSVTVAGTDLLSDPVAARRKLGYLPENVALYTEMRVREYLAYRARLEGMPRGEVQPAIADTIERCLLGEVEHQIIGTLSKGYRQRVGLAAAILHGPQVLVLDEPTVGLDPKQIIAIRELIRDLGKTRTLLLSTHILPEVEQLCDRVLIIDRGRIVAEGTPDELQAQARGAAVVRITVRGAGAEPGEAFAALGVPGVDVVRPGASDDAAADERQLLLEHAPEVDVREEVFRAVVDQGWVLLEMVEEAASLEDVFVRLTAQDAASEDAVDPDSEGDPGEAEDADAGEAAPTDADAPGDTPDSTSDEKEESR